jgi:DNA-binding NarL/FixJ family response regulator
MIDAERRGGIISMATGGAADTTRVTVHLLLPDPGLRARVAAALTPAGAPEAENQQLSSAVQVAVVELPGPVAAPPGCPVVAFVARPTGDLVAQALDAGARGLLLVDDPLTDLPRAIHAVAAGGGWISPRLIGGVGHRLIGQTGSAPACPPTGSGLRGDRVARLVRRFRGRPGSVPVVG